MVRMKRSCLEAVDANLTMTLNGLDGTTTEYHLA